MQALARTEAGEPASSRVVRRCRRLIHGPGDRREWKRTVIGPPEATDRIPARPEGDQGPEGNWPIRDLPAGTAKCLEARCTDRVQLVVEYFGRRRGLVYLDASVNRKGLADILKRDFRPLAVLLIRRGEHLTARVVGASRHGAPVMDVDLGTAIACLEAGVHGTLRCETESARRLRTPSPVARAASCSRQA